MTLFTDLTETDPAYFWIRGAIWGFVLATLIWCVVVPWFKKRREDRKRDRLGSFAQYN